MVVKINKKLLQFYLKQNVYVVLFVLNLHITYKNCCVGQDDLDCIDNKVQTLKMCLNYLCNQCEVSSLQMSKSIKFYNEIPARYYEKNRYYLEDTECMLKELSG